jgi:hypothetical protein
VVTVTPGTATTLRIAANSLPTTSTVGICTPVTVERLDVEGNLTTLPANQTAMVAASGPGSAGLLVGAACPVSNSSASVSFGANVSGTFAYEPRSVGAVTFTIGTSPVSVSANTTVVAGAVSSLRFVAPPSTGRVGVCVPLTVEARDVGNNSVAATASVSTSAAGFFYGASNCTGPNVNTLAIGVGGQSFGFLPQAVATTNVTATVAPAISTVVSLSISAGTLASLALSPPPPASLAAGACSGGVTVSGADALGNATALPVVTLSMTGATFFRSANCTGAPATTLGGGSATSEVFSFQTTTVGNPVTLTATSSGASASQNWNIISSGPNRIRWKPLAEPPGTLSRYACSAAFRVQVVDSNGVPTSTSTARPLNLAPSLATGFVFFTDSSCLTPASSLSIAAGQSETGDLYALSFASGTFSVSATDASASSVGSTSSVSVSVSGAASGASLVVTPAVSTVLFRECAAMTIQRRIGTTGYSGAFATSVSLSTTGSGASGLTFHTASDCNDVAATSFTIPPNASTVTVYMRGRSAEPAGGDLNNTGPTLASVSVTAADALSFFPNGSSGAIGIHPAVRRGQCTSNQSTFACAINPPLADSARARSFLTYQAVVTNGPSAPQDSSVVCSLNTATNVAVTCVRTGNSQTVEVGWQVVTMGAGLQVNHFSGPVSSSAPNEITIDVSSAGLGSTAGAFVLVGFQGNGSNYSDNDAPTAELTSPTVVSLRLGTGVTSWAAGSYALQVVQLGGTTTDRGVITPINGATPGATYSAAVAFPPAGTSQVLLHSQRSRPSSELAHCNYRLRGALPSTTSVEFSRGDGTASGCTTVEFDGIAWERISFPASLAQVQTFSVPISGNTRTSPVQVVGAGSLPLHLTWSVVGGQGPGGQSGGETNFSSEDILGTSQGRIEYSRTASETRLTLTRGFQANGVDSQFGVWVVSFVP